MSRAEPLKTRALLRPYALLYLYRRRLRVNAAQELFAGIGIAIAVALVFAATVAESSIAGSSAEVVHAVAGPASLQLRARSGAGFDEHLLGRVQRLPGVKQAAPLLEQSATVRAPNGRSTTIDLAGTDTSLAVLDGLGETLPLAALTPGTIGLSKASAEMIGIPTHPLAAANGSARAGSAGAGYVTLQMRGQATRLRVSAVLGHEAVGALSRALVAVMPLGRMQQLSGLPGQITRIFVETQPGAEEKVRAEMQALAGGRLTVAPADQDVDAAARGAGAEPPGQRPVRGDRRAARLPARVQRDAADRPRAPPGDRRPAPGRHEASGDRADGRCSRRSAWASPPRSSACSPATCSRSAPSTSPRPISPRPSRSARTP